MKRLGSFVRCALLACACSICGRAADDVEVLLAKAAQSYQEGQYQRAEETLSRAVLIVPERGDLCYRRAVVQLQQRNVDAALSSFQRAVQLSPLLGPAWNGLGAAQYAKADYPSARVSLGRALELGADDPLPHLNLGLVCLEQGDVAAASGSLQRSSQLAPNDPRLNAALARLQGKKTAAEQRREQGVKDPTAGLNDLMATLANAYQAANDLRNAATSRDLGGALSGLGRLGGMLAKRKGKEAPAAPQATATGPFALDAAGRIAPALAYEPTSPAPITPPSAPAVTDGAPVSPSPDVAAGTPGLAQVPPSPSSAPAARPAAPTATSYAMDAAAIQQQLTQLAQALSAKNLDAAVACFAPAIRSKVREAFSSNPERMQPLADLMRQAKLTLLSDQTAPDADGATRRGELTLSSADRTIYLQMAKLDGLWLVSAI